jgi:hypothetical protein
MTTANTKKLEVGQDVYMLNSVYIIKGRVAKVTPSGVDVRELPWRNRPGGELRHFDTNGREEYNSREEWGPEWASFELDDLPFEDRTALLEQ